MKRFNDSKSCGFIEHQTSEDVFVQYTAILGDGFRNLNGGQQVEFIITLGRKGPQAQDFCGFAKQSPIIESKIKKIRAVIDLTARDFIMVGAPGFEPGTSYTPCKRASRTAPRPV